MAWSAPAVYVTGELMTAVKMNLISANLRAIGEHQPGDLLPTYVTHANATSTTLTEPRTGWYIANGATFTPQTTLQSNIGGGTTLPDFRGRMFVAPGTQDGHAFARGETGGEYDHALTTAELAAHVHGVSDPGHVHNYDKSSGGNVMAAGANFAVTTTTLTATAAATTGITVTSTGSGTAHATMSPYRVGGMLLVKNEN